MERVKRRIDEEYARQQCELLGNNFYKSRVWKTVRQRALKIYGTECHCCLSRGSKLEPLHVDHIKPKSLYPNLALDITNLQILCKKCNEQRSNLHETDYRPELHKKFAEDYAYNNKSIDKIILERTKLSDEKKLKQTKNPRNLKKLSKSERKKRKKEWKGEIKLQVMFLQEARAALSRNNLSTFIDTFEKTYGTEVTNRLIKRCNFSHKVSRITG